MAVYQVKDIVRDIRVILDQNQTSRQLSAIEDVETLALDEIIGSKICEAVRTVHLAAPYHLLGTGVEWIDPGVYWGELSSGWVLLPDDFLRLVVFKMSDWERPVYTAISTQSEEYKLQSSRFKGLRGNSQRPVCAIGLRPEGRVLEFYSCKDNSAFVARAEYIAEPEIDRYDNVWISERCYRAVLYQAAAMTLVTLGESQRAIELMNISKTYLQ